MKNLPKDKYLYNEKNLFYEDFVKPFSIICAIIAPFSVPLYIVKIFLEVKYTWVFASIPIILAVTIILSFLFAVAIFFVIRFLWRMFT